MLWFSGSLESFSVRTGQLLLDSNWSELSGPRTLFSAKRTFPYRDRHQRSSRLKSSLKKKREFRTVVVVQGQTGQIPWQAYNVRIV